VWVLGCQLSTDSQVEDGLPQGLDVFGARGEAREVVEVKAGVPAEGGGGLAVGGGGGLVNAGQAGCHQPVAPLLPSGPRRLQPIAQRHQLVDLGDDAVLFGEGWKTDRYPFKDALL